MSRFVIHKTRRNNLDLHWRRDASDSDFRPLLPNDLPPLVHIPVDGLDGNPVPAVWVFDLSDDTTVIEAGPESVYNFRAPYDLKPINFFASLTNASTSGQVLVDVHRNGVSIFTTPITIDPGVESSWHSLTPSVIADDHTEWTASDKIEVFVLQAGTDATGLKLYINQTAYSAADPVPGPGGTSDHGELIGLGDDDHPQYLTTGRASAWLAGQNITAARVQISDPGDLFISTDLESVLQEIGQAMATANIYFPMGW